MVRPTDADELAMAAKAAGPRGAIARGLGRAYGDSAMNAGGLVVSSTGVSGLLELDHPRGTARVLAGTSLDGLLRAIVPQGWFVPVTPGTRYITVGGAIAADVHGKDHHATGSFGAHVQSLVLAPARRHPPHAHPRPRRRRVLGHVRGHGPDRHRRRGDDSPAPDRDQPARGSTPTGCPTSTRS